MRVVRACLCACKCVPECGALLTLSEGDGERRLYTCSADDVM